MKKYLSIIFAVIVLASVLVGCTGQGSRSEQNMVSNTNAPTSTPEPENMPNDSFSKEDYQKLLALQFADYRNMTVSEFQNKVWQMTDTVEYQDLLERFSKDETLYRMKDSNETASFLFYVLEPLTAEKWQTRDYRGAVASDFPFPAENAVLEYTYTLTILDADKVMVKDYNDMRLTVKDALNDILRNRTKEELQNETLMLTELKTYVDEILSYTQTPELSVTIEYAYLPLSVMEGAQQSAGFGDSNNQETRSYSNGTEEDYRSLLALKTPDYQNMSLADFNMALLEWANEDYNRMERIAEDTTWNDFQVNLTSEELSFVKLTVFLSYTENGTYIRKEENPSFAKDMPQRTIWENEYAAWCSLYYQFSYHISDKNAVTVGERDQQIEKMISAIQTFWNNTEIENLLKMNQRDVVDELEKLAALCSNDGITITINKEQVQYECMDERGYAKLNPVNNQTATPTNGDVPTNTSAAYAKLIAYKTKDYGQKSIADFNAALAPTYDELPEFLAAQANVINGISPDDENYDFFTTTMNFSAYELYCEQMGEEITFSIDLLKESRPCSYLDESGEPVYDFTCLVEANVAYSINDPKLISVAERDKALLTFKEEMQNYLNDLSEAEITGGNIKKMLIDKSAELVNSLSTENMRLSPCEIYLLEINSHLLEITGEAEEAKY